MASIATAIKGGVMKRNQKANVRHLPLKNWQEPNFMADGKLYLVRCYVCDPERGKENYALAVAAGVCAWCGWTAKKPIARAMTRKGE